MTLFSLLLFLGNNNNKKTAALFRNHLLLRLHRRGRGRRLLRHLRRLGIRMPFTGRIAPADVEAAAGIAVSKPSVSLTVVAAPAAVVKAAASPSNIEAEFKCGRISKEPCYISVDCKEICPKYKFKTGVCITLPHRLTNGCCCSNDESICC
ncbi:unnamed protein product [Dovyalis caffra]|uniref:Uncharacterized protein n=1 Tax=Dovyalis caffra TaxID=77055 RepID=A0AAV1RU88_9ROSI|nr:unnamed protein product [Dovyalis caffra]